jgi:hypothetical protein
VELWSCGVEELKNVKVKVHHDEKFEENEIRNSE